MPRARVRVATVVKPGLLRSIRAPKRRSWRSDTDQLPEVIRRGKPFVTRKVTGSTGSSVQTGKAEQRDPTGHVWPVQRLSGQAPLAIVEERLRDADHPKLLLERVGRVDEQREAELLRRQEFSNVSWLITGDRQDDETLPAEALMEALEVWHFLTARRAGGAPEVHQHHFAAQGLRVPGVAVHVA